MKHIEMTNQFFISDLVAYILGGLGLEFDHVVCNIASKKSKITLQDAQFLLMNYESRLEQYHASATIDIGQASANSSIKSANFARGGSQFQNTSHGRTRGRRGGRGRRYFNQRLTCQLCGNAGHFSAICYHRFDQSFSGTFGKPQQHPNQQPMSANCGPIQSNFQGNFAQQQLDYSYPHQNLNALMAAPSTSSLHRASPIAAVSSPSQSQSNCPAASQFNSTLQPCPSTVLQFNSQPMVTRSKSGITKPKSFISSTSTDSSAASIIDVPSIVSAALADSQWNAAMQAEFDALERNKTWSL
ncbi:hypothetical protein ACOSQ4_030785 [Xanthoceras sorbifolium]